MTGFNQITRIRKFEHDIEQLGFRMSRPKHGGFRDEDVIALLAKDEDSLPIYSRDSELFVGTMEQAEEWIRGIHWARQYDALLKLSDGKKRARKEQDVRNRNLMQQIKTSGANE